MSKALARTDIRAEVFATIVEIISDKCGLNYHHKLDSGLMYSFPTHSIHIQCVVDDSIAIKVTSDSDYGIREKIFKDTQKPEFFDEIARFINYIMMT